MLLLPPETKSVHSSSGVFGFGTILSKGFGVARATGKIASRRAISSGSIPGSGQFILEVSTVGIEGFSTDSVCGIRISVGFRVAADNAGHNVLELLDMN